MNTHTLHRMLVRDPKLQVGTLWLDLRTSVDNSLHCPAVTAAPFLCRHKRVHVVYEVP